MTKYAKLRPDGVIDVISLFPQEGYVAVPDTVFAGFTLQQNGSFAAPVIEHVVSADEVKDECRRRLIAAFGKSDATELENAIRDATMRAVELQDIYMVNGAWTVAEQVEVEGLRASRAIVAQHDAASKALREMDPIPDDFASDSYWPGFV